MCIIFYFPNAFQNRAKHQHTWLKISTMLALMFYINVSHAENRLTLTLNDTNEAPFTNKAGNGFLNVIAGEVFRRAGLDIKLEKFPPERGLIQANAGQLDGDLTRIAGLNKTYPNLIQVPEKLMDWYFVAFARNTKLSNANWDTLKPLLVGHVKGWKIFEKNLAKESNVTVVNDEEQLFNMLDKNRIDVALYEQRLGLVLIKKMDIKNIHVVEPALAKKEMFIYLNKRHADKIPAIVTALRNIKADGTYSRICHEKLDQYGATEAQCAAK